MATETALQYLTYIILSAAETWIGFKLFKTYLTRNSVKTIF